MVDQAVTYGQGQYSFRIQGDLHHNDGGILPPPGQPAIFAQLYIMILSHNFDFENNAIPISTQSL